MADGSSFYDWFMATDELEVCRALSNERYQPPGTLPQEQLHLLARNLPAMDEGHAASAVLILSHHEPRLLLPHLTRLLADRRSGVWCAAEGALLLLPRDEVTPERFGQFREAVRQRTGSPEDSYVLKTLGDRLRQSA